MVSFRKCGSGMTPPDTRATVVMIPKLKVVNDDLVMIFIGWPPPGGCFQPGGEKELTVATTLSNRNLVCGYSEIVSWERVVPHSSH